MLVAIGGYMLELLNRVQTYDLDIDALGGEKDNVPESLLAVRQQYSDLEQHLQEVSTKHDQVRAKVRENELELANLANLKQTAATAAFNASNSKEASQYQNQELQFGTRIQELEEDTLPLMERLEQLADNIDSIQADLDALKPNLDELEKQERQRLSAIDDRQAAIAKGRDALAADVDKPLLQQYEQIRRAKRGIGVVPIKPGQHCGGCSARLPLHVVQKVMHANKIIKCPNCGRILYFPKHEPDDA